MHLNDINQRRHAVVMGGSMAGLLVARVLCDHYSEVTLLERDALPAGVEQRRGVPQGRHTHGLLASGREVLERFFPGISSTLVSRGAITGDVVRDSRWFFQGQCLSRPFSGLDGLLLTRPLLEAAVREQVLALRNIRRRDNAVVAALGVSEDSSRVIGVRVGAELLTADLVVDATGRGSRSPLWLREMGYESPREDSVHVALGYTTRFFRRSPADLNGDVAAIIPPTSEGKMGGVMLAQEGDRWTVTLIAHFGNYAPEELERYIEFARRLPAPYIYEVIRRAEPLGEPNSARFPANLRLRYEELNRFPGGYLVIGDALCSFNPIYGQGMSVAALEAVELEKLLAERRVDLPRQFFARVAKVIDMPWSIAVGNDLRMKEATGQRTAGVKFINWYIARLHRAAHRDPVCSLAFHRVGNLLAPPPSILRPRVVCRVLWRHMAMRALEASSAPSVLS